MLRYTITCVCSPPYATVVKTTSPLNWYILTEIRNCLFVCLFLGESFWSTSMNLLDGVKGRGGEGEESYFVVV